MQSPVRIPKFVFQTSKLGIPTATAIQLRSALPGWKYQYFSDEDILTYVHDHPIDEFPEIEDIMQNRIPTGAHKADLFRYYVLYLEGGVFIDSDGMIYQPMEPYVENYDFFSALAIGQGNIFQGILGASPRSPIIHAALKNSYAVYAEGRGHKIDYFYFTRDLYRILQRPEIKLNPNLRIHLFREEGPESICAQVGASPIFDHHGNTFFVHYFLRKRVPAELPWSNRQDWLRTAVEVEKAKFQQQNKTPQQQLSLSTMTLLSSSPYTTPPPTTGGVPALPAKPAERREIKLPLIHPSIMISLPAPSSVPPIPLRAPSLDSFMKESEKKKKETILAPKSILWNSRAENRNASAGRNRHPKSIRHVHFS